MYRHRMVLSMRTIIAGSRTCIDMEELKQAHRESGFIISTILSGGAEGADILGENYAIANNVALEIYPAEWKKYAKKAGFIRNALMATKAEALIALWDGHSSGTRHMINVAKKMNLKIHVHVVKPKIKIKASTTSDILNLKLECEQTTLQRHMEKT